MGSDLEKLGVRYLTEISIHAPRVGSDGAPPMEYLTDEIKEAFEYYLLRLTPDNMTIMLARLMLAVKAQEEGMEI